MAWKMDDLELVKCEIHSVLAQVDAARRENEELTGWRTLLEGKALKKGESSVRRVRITTTAI